MHLVMYNPFQKETRSNVLRMCLDPFPKPLKIYQRNPKNFIFPSLCYVIYHIYLLKTPRHVEW